MSGDAALRLQPWNRKFIGCKQALLPLIEELLAAEAPEPESLCDPFAGSGVVAVHFARRGVPVIAGDLLYSCYLPLAGFLGALGPVDEARLHCLLDELNQLGPAPGYCAREYGGTYFTTANAARIDAVRERIAAWRHSGHIDAATEAALLTSLLYAADKAANTVGQYDAFLKHLGAPPYAADGTHRVDAMVYKPLRLLAPAPPPAGRHQALCGDARALLTAAKAEVVYLDPPYNTRQYADNYHVLENIARWQKPPLVGKTRKFDRRSLSSPFSSRRQALAALAAVIEAARCRLLILSYSNEGILSDEQIIACLGRRGPVEVHTHAYPVFGRGAGRSRRRPVQERLFVCRVR